MTNSRRPRVAAIGLDDPELASIALLCGELRPANSLPDYLQRYSWTETDVVVSRASLGRADVSVNLMIVGPVSVSWSTATGDYAGSDIENTERELAVPPDCPDLYRPLAAELSSQLRRAAEPPAVMNTSRRQGRTALIETTSGKPVALRLVLPAQSVAAGGKAASPLALALLLPEASNLVAWFRAFLCELYESDPSRVPQAPPRLNQPSDWYTPQEKDLAHQISQIESAVERLSTERDHLQNALAAEEERAERGIRRVLWTDGDDLVTAVRDILANLGFVVRNMDAEWKQGEPKREDLRLTHQGVPGWEAIVEVKGYTSGTKTNDARQIRENRDRYITEEGRPPGLTVWLSNPYRTMEPSSRPAPDQNVKDTAVAGGFVHALGSDLYRQWALVAAGSLGAETVVQSLVNADPGLWTPLAPSPST